MIDDEYQGPRYFGKYKGFVRDNADPEGRGRVRCFCPQVMGPIDDDQHWLGWAEANLPWMGGINTLDFGPPLTKEQNEDVEVGVWIEFEGGIPDLPIWCGTWIPAPTREDPNAQIDLTQAAGFVGGSIVDNPPAGSEVGDINPPKPQPNVNETRLMAKVGREIVIGVDEGGFIVLGPYGVQLVGVQVMTNGRLLDASTGDKVVG